MKRCLFCFNTYRKQYNLCPFCGEQEASKAKEPIQLAPGTILADRFVIGAEIGSGGFGIVYKAWDNKLDTVVAVKEFFVKRLMTRPEGNVQVKISIKNYTEYNYRKERFLAEARNMAKLSASRGIPKIVDFFEANNTAYIVMELLEGMALNTYMKRSRSTDPEFIDKIAKEVGCALISLHGNGIIHRDVSPDNIFIHTRKNGEIAIMLMDLGAAKLADTTDDVIDIILKPGYSPVEQYENNNDIDERADVYAFGATLYYMLTGKKPDESTNRAVNDEVEAPHKLFPEIDEDLSKAVMKAISVERDMRFANVSEMLAAINKEPITKHKNSRKKHKKQSLHTLGAAVFAALGAAVFAFAFFLIFGNHIELNLAKATIDVWYCAEYSENEHRAMQTIIDDFETRYPNVTVNLKAIEPEHYITEIKKAMSAGDPPDLFESTMLPQGMLAEANDISDITKSSYAGDCLFIDKINTQNKQVPLAIEIPVAYVITKGITSTKAPDVFTNVSDFGKVGIAADPDCYELIKMNFGDNNYLSSNRFYDSNYNTSPVMLSSTMSANKVKSQLINFEKRVVPYAGSGIVCSFTYKWSICSADDNELQAAKRLLSYMLTKDYQDILMLSQCNDGQVPVNKQCFMNKLDQKYLQPYTTMYDRFVFYD